MDEIWRENARRVWEQSPHLAKPLQEATVSLHMKTMKDSARLNLAKIQAKYAENHSINEDLNKWVSNLKSELNIDPEGGIETLCSRNEVLRQEWLKGTFNLMVKTPLEPGALVLLQLQNALDASAENTKLLDYHIRFWVCFFLQKIYIKI